MKKTIFLFPFILFLLFLSPSLGLVTPKYGVLYANNNQVINYNFTFPSVPVVLTSAQVNGRAVSSCAVNVGRDNFVISLRDDAGNPVPSAWVQWIAFIPDASLKMVGSIMVASHGQRISFNLPNYPVIITNAQKGGVALISGAMNNSPTGFDLYLVDSNGNPVNDAWVIWGAIIPEPQLNGFKGEVKVLSNGSNISFTPPFTSGPSYVLSAQPGVIAGAVNNRNDGFTLSLIKHDGTPAQNVWTQWLGFAGLPSTVVPATQNISYTEVSTSHGPVVGCSGNYRYSIDANGYLKAWCYAYAKIPASDVVSYVKAFRSHNIKINAPTNDFYTCNLTMEVDVKGLIGKIDYALPVGASDTQYLGKVTAGIVENVNLYYLESQSGYRAIIWQKASRDWLEFIESSIKTILGGYGSIFVPGYDVAVTLIEVANQSVNAAEVVNGKYRIEFKNIKLKGNTNYSIFVCIEGKARAVCAGLAESVCEVDFYYLPPYIGDSERNDPLGGRGVKILSYNLTFNQ
ncbi:MAG: hypothetical protein ABDH25_04110 [Dictyoglomaceae bacterium]